jgi:transketolase
VSRGAWQQRFELYAREHPALAAQFSRRMAGELPPDWQRTAEAMLAAARAVAAPTASRKSSQNVLETLVPALPELLGGSADLTWSNLTAVKASASVDANPGGNYVHYGVREFGMAALMNGIALHGGFIPYGGTFAVFSDYARSGIRMSALMKARVVYVLTHDSIGLGEDGPTHQPVEHAASLRLIPNLDVWRPCDGTETAIAWRAGVERADGPSALLLSRQNLPQVASAADDDAIARGGYVLSESATAPRVVLIATGSEVAIALEAQKRLADEGLGARVVSMPCTSAFDRQPREWQARVLPPALPRVAIEAGHPDYWRKYVGLDGEAIGIATFGESAPAAKLYEHFGLTAEAVAAAARRAAGSGRSIPIGV